ncbi:MAG: cell wall hydrolase, partial [Sphingomicrobium sp.]
MASLILDRPLRLARAYPREAAIALGALAFSAAAMASVVHLSPANDPLAGQIAQIAPPPPPVNGLENVAPDQAVAINRAAPLTAAAGPAAPPFAMAGVNPNARDTALTCLAQAIYYEAGNESDEGQRGVAQVVLNRVRHPAFPASVCGVVYQGSTRPTGCQFTFTCDGSLARRPDAEGWTRARRVAAAALSGQVAGSVGYATHYHADYVLPTWAGTLARTDVIGAHLFYRWNGGWGQPGSFTQAYLGHEASPEALRSAALSAHADYLAAGTPTAGHQA